MDSSAMDIYPPIQEILLEFRAGKMIMEGKKVIPDTRKGLFRLGRGEEGLVHFQWLDRSNNNVIEDDQIVFPEEAVFEKVNQASGRVYILKFHTDDRRFFYWMQEPEAVNDTELCNSVNLYLNHPLEFLDDEPDASIPPQNSEETIDEDIPSSAGNMVLPRMGGEASSGVASSGPVKLADLQRILSNIGSSEDTVDPDAGLGLADILRPDLISPLIKELPVGQQLASYLPEGQWTAEELIELLQSPPFRQQVDSFTYVLRTGQIDLTQFGIDPSKYNLTVLSFLEALEDSMTEATGSAESLQDDKDLKSQMCNPGDQMDES